MAFSILHFADLHLDAAFTGSRLPAALARHCREQLRQTLRRLVDIAKERGADAVTIAGDLFERERLSPDTAAFLIGEFERLMPIPIYIAPGNHDAADASSLYRRGRWPEHVTIFISNRLTERRLTEEISLWSAGHRSPSERQNFLQNFNLSDFTAFSGATASAASPQSPGVAPRFHILLLHATLVAAHSPSSSNHAPLTIGDIREAGFPLALLGHYHTTKTLRAGDTVAIYPGSPQPLGFDEPGQHGACWIQLVPDQPPQIEFIPLAGLRFETVEVPVDDCLHRDQLVDKVMVLQRELGNAFIRLRLIGQAPPTLFVDLPSLTARLQEQLTFVHLENLTRPSADLQQLAQEPTVRGAFVRNLIAAIEREPESRQRYMNALIYGLQAFNQEEIALR
ncbi:MAG: metallophosphoesterase [candidate division KSB1 bacterium]|nr:metallophosphoesterase [candidate division KSB1 bacterium]